MSNFNIGIDLMKFWGAKVITTKSGEEVIVIPIEANKFKKTQKGAVMTYLQATEKKQVGQYGDTHFIKPRFSKDAFVSLSDEQRNSIPFVGSVYGIQGGYNNNGVQNSHATQTNSVDFDDSMF